MSEIEQLREIGQLGPDWDSYGASAPSPLAIRVAGELLRAVESEYGGERCQAVSPRADGGIQIEWGEQPVEIAVRVDPAGTLGYLYVDHGAYKDVPTASLPEVLQLIGQVVSCRDVAKTDKARLLAMSSASPRLKRPPSWVAHARPDTRYADPEYHQAALSYDPDREAAALLEQDEEEDGEDFLLS